MKYIAAAVIDHLFRCASQDGEKYTLQVAKHKEQSNYYIREDRVHISSLGKQTVTIRHGRSCQICIVSLIPDPIVFNQLCKNIKENLQKSPIRIYSIRPYTVEVVGANKIISKVMMSGVGHDYRCYGCNHSRTGSSRCENAQFVEKVVPLDAITPPPDDDEDYSDLIDN